MTSDPHTTHGDIGGTIGGTGKGRTAAVGAALLGAMCGLLWNAPLARANDGDAGADAERQADSGPCIADASDADKRQARAITDAAHALNLDFRFEEAAAAYARVIALWDHPEYRLALARALYNAAKLLESHAHFSRAVQCGRGVLSDQQLREAQSQLQRLRAQLATVEIRSDSPDAQIILDGRPLAMSDRATRIAYPGHHVVRARRDGYLEQSIEFDVAAGQRALVQPHMLRAADAIVYERRFPRWQPWAVVAGGWALALVGTGLRVHVTALEDGYRQKLEEQCLGQFCEFANDSPITAEWKRIKIENRVAIGALITAGATLAAGATLVLLNQPKARQRRGGNEGKVQIVPLVTADNASVSLIGRF